MRGTVTKKRNRWYIVVDIGRDAQTGRRRQKWHGSWSSKREAQAALPAIVGSIHAGTYVEPAHATVAEFLLDEWLPAARTSLKPSTVELYRTLLSAYVNPRIGGLKLQTLNPAHLNRLYGELLESGRRGGTPLGAETTAKVHRLLHRALRDAVAWGRIARNPAGVARPPRAQRTQPATWDAAQLSRFLVSTTGDALNALWVLLATTGMRRGEALGLRWQDVDLDAARLSVRQTLAYVGTTATLSEPKTNSSRRLISIPDTTTQALRSHRAGQAEVRLLAGSAYAEELDLVFAHPDGSPLNPATVSRTFDRLVREADLPRITLHSLRHSWATLALLEGIPTKVVSEILGHSSTRVTEDVYQHVSPGMQADATSRVDRLLRDAR